MKAVSSGYETIAEKAIGCYSNNYALAHFEPGVSLKHIPWWGAMTLHYFHHFGFKYFKVVLHDARCIPVFYEARKLNVRQTLQKWCYFENNSMRQIALLRRKVGGVRHSDIII